MVERSESGAVRCVPLKRNLTSRHPAATVSQQQHQEFWSKALMDGQSNPETGSLGSADTRDSILRIQCQLLAVGLEAKT